MKGKKRKEKKRKEKKRKEINQQLDGWNSVIPASL